MKPDWGREVQKKEEHKTGKLKRNAKNCGGLRKKMASESKRRRIDQGQPRVGQSVQSHFLLSKRSVSSPAAKKDAVTLMQSSAVPMTHASGTSVQHAKKYAVTQAQQEGCTGNFRSFDSPFGNFLVPVIPTRADLSR
ncbi:hypothetical protein HHK36_014235 [Tetracentron sinense]|uniref:Uncharacterized protein n=1 Tax=Tetracentron sinense TaxID=13715 RepID=A0A834Z7M4_TETSI|nr:hypothetical protein HHK36_014235 [Tetracentron sinense]